jgi:glycine/D-amino acid oxidase-like deaminating enzyme
MRHHQIFPLAAWRTPRYLDPSTTMKKRKLRVAVMGAGAFGGWSALYLQRAGAQVTMIDAWAPGNSRSSSGGETRVIRGTYGADSLYTDLAARALLLWRSNERRWKRQFLHRIGVLWMAAGDDSYERSSLGALRAAKIPYEKLAPRQLTKRWPQINFGEVEWAVFEPESGFLLARAACRAVAEEFVAEGGTFRTAAVVADALDAGNWKELALSDGSRLRADVYIFACGPWMGELFPQTIGRKIEVTKQDIFFFGPPPGDARYDDQHLPVWGDHRPRFMYGIPGNQGRGFKIADDTRGPAFDPTHGERVIDPERLRLAREYMAFRFPGMKDAPLVETRVCQYEQTTDSHFIVDRHPLNENIWLLGGGSGHGFKHGPVLGELVARLVLKEEDPPPAWRLARFR